jgi:hypothetical protein
MRHPLDAIPAGRRRTLFAPLVVLTLGMTAVMAVVDRPLRTSAAPRGIVSFELAGDAATSARIIDSWDERARRYAAFGLGLDFLFLCAYSTSIACACLWAGGVFGARGLALAGAGPPLAWGQWLAALLDAEENSALAVLLLAGVRDPWPRVAWVCASLKFLLVAAGLLYAAAGLLARGLAARPPSAR